MHRRKFLSALGLGSGSLLAVPTIAKAAGSDPNSWQPDGAGTVARFGVLTPDFDPVPESEMWAMVPRGISIHAALVAPSGAPGASFVVPPHVYDAFDLLVELAPPTFLLGYTSTSYELSEEVDDRLRAQLG